MFFAISNKTLKSPSELLTFISNVLKQRNLPPLKPAARNRIMRETAFAYCVILLLFPEATKRIRCYADNKQYTTDDFLNQPDKVSDLNICSVLTAHLRNFDSKMPGGAVREQLLATKANSAYVHFLAINYYREIDTLLRERGLWQKAQRLAASAEQESWHKLRPLK
jgi:hypothetical protein